LNPGPEYQARSISMLSCSSNFRSSRGGATRARGAIVRLDHPMSGTIHSPGEPSGFDAANTHVMAHEWAAGSGAWLNASQQWCRYLGSHCIAERVGILPLLVVFTSSTSKLGMQLRHLSYPVEATSPPRPSRRTGWAPVASTRNRVRLGKCLNAGYVGAEDQCVNIVRAFVGLD